MLLCATALLAGLSACGGGGAGGGDGSGEVGGRLRLPGSAFARRAAAAPPRAEVEPNAGALAPDDLGALRSGERRRVTGRVDAAGGDARDVLRVLLPERVVLTLRLASAPLAGPGRDNDGDALALTLHDPTSFAEVGAGRPGAEPGTLAADLTAKGWLDLVVAGRGAWTLDLEAAAPPSTVPASFGAPVWAGETLPGDRLEVVGRGAGGVRLSTPVAQRLQVTADAPVLLRAAGGALRLEAGRTAWLDAGPGAPVELEVLEEPAGAEPAPAPGSPWRLTVASRDATAAPEAAGTALVLGAAPRARLPAPDLAGYAAAAGHLRADQALVAPAPGARAALLDALAVEGVRVLDGLDAGTLPLLPEGVLRVALGLPEGDPAERASATLARTLALARHPEAARAEPNHRRRALTVPNDPRYGEQWHYPLMRLPEAWDVTTGSASVIVAVIDTGITAHPDLAGRSVAGYDFISDAANAADGDGRDSDPTDPGDGSGGSPPSWHGTHVAGTIGAASNNGTGVAGVTWGCKLMNLRVLGVDGGDDFDIANAILYAAGLSNVSGRVPAQRAHVINMSLGGGDANTTLGSAIASARAAGVTVVAAAGNESTSQRSYPAAFDGVIAVGAVDRDRALTSYSNTGSWVDCVAPGGDSAARAQDGVLSTLRNDAGTAWTYAFYDGTSMASPHVAGVAALVLSVAPALSPDEVEGVLMATAVDLGASGRDTTYGNGLIDAYAAVVRARSGGSVPPPPPPPPSGGDEPAPGVDTIYVLLVDAATDETLAQADVDPQGDLGFALGGLAGGSYLLVAGTDRDGDGTIGDVGDLYGAWPSWDAPEVLALAPGERRLGLVLDLLSDDGAAAGRVPAGRLRRLR